MPVTKYIWDEENLLAEADGNDNINVVYTNEPQQYGNLISTRIAGATSYHHFDGLGSTRQLTNAAGATTDSMIYGAWGDLINRTGVTVAALLWIGEHGYYDDSQMPSVYVRARSYQPAIARWSAVDLVSAFTGLWPFAYVKNSPV